MEVDLGRGLRPDQWARFCGRHTCADVIEQYARGRLMERTTSHKWYFDTIEPQTTNNSKIKSGSIQGVDPNGNEIQIFRESITNEIILQEMDSTLNFVKYSHLDFHHVKKIILIIQLMAIQFVIIIIIIITWQMSLEHLH